MNCEICKNIFQQPELMMACDYTVTDISDGIVCTVNLKKPELMPKLRAFMKNDRKVCDKFRSLTKKDCDEKLCPGCAAYFDFTRRGLKEEQVDTSNGALTVARTNDPALLKDLHAWSAEIRQMMASFDVSEAFQPNQPTMVLTDVCEGAASKEGSACEMGTCSCCPKECAMDMSKLPKEVLEDFMKCELCKVFMEDPSMMAASDHKIVLLKNGIAICDIVKDPSKVKVFQDMTKKFMAKAKEMKGKSASEGLDNLCLLCRQFAELDQTGAIMDWSVIPRGTLHVITGADEGLVAKIHDMARQFKAFEDMMK
jgi:hypothetical protein